MGITENHPYVLTHKFSLTISQYDREKERKHEGGIRVREESTLRETRKREVGLIQLVRMKNLPPSPLWARLQGEDTSFNNEREKRKRERDCRGEDEGRRAWPSRVEDGGGLGGRSALGRLVGKRGFGGFCERLRAKSSISFYHNFEHSNYAHSNHANPVIKQSLE